MLLWRYDLLYNKPMKEEGLTIVIPSLSPDHHELTRKALSFTLESLATFKGEVIVAYNGPGTKKPQGQCQATNEAVKKAKTEWIMISNNDMVFQPGWFDTFTKVVKRENLLVASPNLVEPRKGAPPFLEKFCGGVGVEGGEPDFNKQCFIDFIETQKPHENISALPTTELIENGANFPVLVRTDVFKSVGMYDENYDPFGSNSDSDLFYKFMISGIIPRRIKNTLVYHFSQTSGTFHPNNAHYVNKNHGYFKEKWGFERASSPDCWYKPTVPYSQLKYKPDFMGKYGEPK